MHGTRVPPPPIVIAVLAGTILGGAAFLDLPLSWLACGFLFAGAGVLRAATAVVGSVEVEGVVVGHVVRPIPHRGGRRPVSAERVRYRGRGIDGVVRDHEVVSDVASAHPAAEGTTRRVSYHPAAPADGRIHHRQRRLIGWWFSILGVWGLVVMNLAAWSVALGWVVVTAAALVAFAAGAPAAPPPAPDPGAPWQPPPPSWPEADDPNAPRGLVPGIRVHLRRGTFVAAGSAFAGTVVLLGILRLVWS